MPKSVSRWEKVPKMPKNYNKKSLKGKKNKAGRDRSSKKTRQN
jgi:hypothetical protein